MKTALLLLMSVVPLHAFDKALLEEHLRESYRLPADVSVSFSDAKPSVVPGFDLVEVGMSRNGMEQSEKLHLSKDGRYYLLGDFKDLKVFPAQERIKKMDLKDAAVRGKADAAVTIVEYTDFQCPYCRKGYEIMRDRIMKDYAGKVRWFYKSLPLGFHPWAEPAAVAVECAKLQGQEKFWKVHDAIFDKQGDIDASNAQEKFTEIAKAAGADPKAFADCYDAKKTLPAVKRDAAEAESMGVNGTPAFLVNGRLISGADLDAIKDAVEASLKKLK